MESCAVSRPTLGKAMVIGGTGFLGHHIVDLLVHRYNTDSIFVVDLNIKRNMRPEKDGVSYYQADITDLERLLTIFEHTRPDVVIHTASPLPQVDEVSTRELYNKVNVRGTQCIIQACQENGVKVLVYTSSASVVSDHTSDLVNVDEGYGQVRGEHQPEYYAESKAEAENFVLAANRQEPFNLLTVAIRPSAIFGEGDQMVLPRLINVYREGKAYIQIGRNDNLFDFTYAGNVAHAHLLAAEVLFKSSVQKSCVAEEKVRRSFSSSTPLNNKVDGECFFITNGSPVYFWDFARSVWVSAGFPYDLRRVWVLPLFVAWVIGLLGEFLAVVLRRPATLTRQRVAFSGMTRYYNISKARERLGYEPLVPLNIAVQKSVQWYLDQERAVLMNSTTHSN
ncbi:sterol-4-alpha-carboxylate 3-dehydrogenase [Xylaria venustula]|nr:sterol-4-alpha-carboxylate 3-dehydrogenase [Xylaria venustula]